MPYEAATFNDFTLPAAGDLSSHQYKFMVVDANGRGTVATSCTSVIIGILQNKPSATDSPARIRPAGNISKLKFGAAANEGAYLTSNEEGFGTATTQDMAHVGAIALHAPGGSGDIQDVLVVCMKHSG